MLSEGRFVDLCGRLAPALDGRATFEILQRAYAEPARTYHNARHIADCLTQFDKVRAKFVRPDETEFALWIHDAIYDSHAKDNESRSAQMAAEFLRRGGAAAEAIEYVERLILATRHNETPSEPDARLIVDIDLSILGRGEAEFNEYDEAIRREYTWVPEDKYREGRATVLRGFLKRERIYSTQEFFEQFEKSARENLQRAILQLR
ncbi:MAG TPA: N-methyl-D-aspartate receptor NMDAR2C subunit [Planctomycetota bacterium]|nr:N-methyl-D-aspartate receptor NMDAR2C subunit [Planctomycetota bacterium]